MMRSQRLLELLQLLRIYSYPVSATTLADKLEVSNRTIYRDINTLREQGAVIDGERGIGYVLRSDNHLPPINFTLDEVYALVLGLRWVKNHADASLVDVSYHAYAKISHILPPHLKEALVDAPLMVASSYQLSECVEQSATALRQAINDEHKVQLTYEDGNDEISHRIIYPLGIGFFEDVQICAAWCELRQAFRHFRLDRIKQVNILNESYTPRRSFLFKSWKRELGISSHLF